MESQLDSGTRAPGQNDKTPYPAVAAVVRPYSQSPIPIWSVAGVFAASSAVPRAAWPPLVYRLGFGAIFAGAGYVLSSGDVRNGSGIATAWSLTYLFLNLRKSLTTNRSPVSLALAGATIASSALYGSEYFLLQDSETESDN